MTVISAINQEVRCLCPKHYFLNAYMGRLGKGPQIQELIRWRRLVSFMVQPL